MRYNRRYRRLNEYNRFLDILDDDDNMSFSDIVRGKYKYFPKDNKELKIIVNELFADKVNNLNIIDVSNITDFTSVFEKKDMTDIDIRFWDVSSG